MKTGPKTYALAAALLIAFSGASEAGRAGSKSSSSSSASSSKSGSGSGSQSTAGKKTDNDDDGASSGKGVNIKVVIPKEGAVVNIDSMVIPADAPHPDNAHRFIDFLMKPEVAAGFTNTTGYANPISGSKHLIKKDIQNDPVIFPSDEVVAKEFQVPPADMAKERERTRLWTTVKTGR